MSTMRRPDEGRPDEVGADRQLISITGGSEGCYYNGCWVQPGAVAIFPYQPTQPTMRPKKYSSEACEKVYLAKQGEFNSYLEIKDETEISEVRDQIVSSLSNLYEGDDGYTIARRLEDDFGIEGSEALVDICSGIQDLFRWEHQRAVAEWVKEEGVKPKLSIGDRVTFLGKECFISGIDEGQAQYLVSETSPKSYWIVNYETLPQNQP